MCGILIILSIILGAHSTPSKYSFSVFENVPLDTYIGKVTLAEANPNCSYHIFGSNNFRLGPSGGIYTTAYLDREIQTEHTFRVSCDNGLTQIEDIKVEVLDVNDNAPVFSRSSYTFSIKEGAMPGTDVGQVSATDLDVGDNGIVSYSIQARGELVFTINPTGHITLTSQPTEPLYVLQITAQDHGLPPIRTTCHVYIISPRTLTFQVPESKLPVSYIGPILRVQPGVEDVFSALHLSPQGVPFGLSLHNHTMSLYNVIQLDREVRDMYHFAVMTTTSGVERLLANVTLVVLDVNDNQPFFSSSMYNISVNADSPAGTALLAVRAIDMDSRSQLVYSITTKSDDQPFVIDPITGSFSLMHTLDRQSYAVEIQVNDGKFSSQAWIYITTVFPEEVVG